MKKFVFIFLCLFSTASFSQDLGKDWNLLSDMDGVKTWNLYLQPEVMIAFEVKSRKKPLDWEKVSGVAFFKSWEKYRKAHAAVLPAVQNWTPKNYVYTEKNGKKFLKVLGTYKNQENTELEFLEIHVFESNKTSRVLYTAPLKEKIDSKIKKDFFTKFLRILEE